MGYNTSYVGDLKFKHELKASELNYLKQHILGQDCREHLNWPENECDYIKIDLIDNFTGIRWSGAEKTCALEEQIKLVIQLMLEKFNNDFGLNGIIHAEGETQGDVYEIWCSDKDIILKQMDDDQITIICPTCNNKIKLINGDK